MTIEKILKISELPKFEIEILLATVLNQDRSFLNAFSETVLSQEQQRKIYKFFDRRSKGEPIPYIVGYKEFFGLKFIVDKNVLIPRPETENLVTEVLNFVNKSHLSNLVIADIGTGSGCIAITLAVKNPSLKIFAADVSSKALNVVRKNAQLHEVSDQVTFLRSNLLEKIDEKIDIIATNLPYIPTRNYEKLPSGIKEFEPKLALNSGDSAMQLYNQLFEQAKSKLNKSGRIFYELDGDIIQVSADDLVETPQE